MAEPFSIEQFRQQMRGQSAQSEPQMPVQQQIPAQPQPQVQPYAAPQQQLAPQHQMAPQYRAAPPPHIQLQQQGQPQAWAPQSRAMPAQQMMQPQSGVPQMPQAPVFAPPQGAMAEELSDRIAPKKSRFALKRPKKAKVPKINEAELTDVGGAATRKLPILPFLLGMVSGVILALVGVVALENLASKKVDQKFEAVAATVAEAAPLSETPQTGIETNDVQSESNE